MRLAAYGGAIASLLARADDLQVSPEDRQALMEVLLDLSEASWSQATRTALYSTRQRRTTALETLGFAHRDAVQIGRSIPFEGPHLFAGQAIKIFDDECAYRKRADETAARFLQSRKLRTVQSRGFKVPSFRSSQALGKSSYDFKSQSHQSTHSAGSFPYGNFSDDLTATEPGRLDGVSGFSGRLPPRPDRPPVTEAPRVHVRGQGLPVQGPPVWTQPRPAVVYQTGIRGSGLPAGTRDKSFLLPRRLVDSRKQPAAPNLSSGFYTGASSDTRLHNLLGEVLPCPDSAPHISGGRDRFTGTTRTPVPGKDRQSAGGHESLTGPEVRPSQDMIAASRLHGESSGCPDGLSAPHEASPDTPPQALSSQRGPLSRPVPVIEQVRPHLTKWMRRQFLSQGKRLRPPQPQVTVTTDASLMGWGTTCLDRMASGMWPSLRPLPHINLLEFRAVMLAGRCFQPLLEGKAVLFQTDNITVVSYINKQGGTHSTQLNQLAAQFWEWCHTAGFTPTAVYLPGQENLVADFLSRGRELLSEWTLHPQVMSRLMQVPLPPSRPLCVEPELPVTALLLPLTGPRRVEGGRLLVPLGRHTGLRLSADSSHPSDPPQDSGGQGINIFHSPMVAQEAVVSGASEPSGSSPKVVANPPGRDQATSLPEETQEPDNPAPVCMAIVGKDSRDSGLSDRAADFIALSLRDSTRESYDSRLGGFFAWCKELSINPRRAPLNKMADFSFTCLIRA